MGQSGLDLAILQGASVRVRAQAARNDPGRRVAGALEVKMVQSRQRIDGQRMDGANAALCWKAGYACFEVDLEPMDGGLESDIESVLCQRPPQSERSSGQKSRIGSSMICWHPPCSDSFTTSACDSELGQVNVS